MASVIIFISLLSIFYIGVYLGKYLSAKSNAIAQLGQSIYSKKNEQLDKSVLFKPIRKGLKEGSLLKIFSIIVVLILLKSISFYFVSLLLITPILLIFQGISMGSMFFYYKKIEGSTDLLASITFWQLMSHCFAGTYGIVVGLNWLFNINLLFNEGLIVYGLLSFLSGCIAAYYEARFLLNTKKPAS